MSSPEPPEVELLNRRSAARLADGRELHSGAYEQLRAQLLRFLRSSFVLRSDADYGEVVDAAVEKFLRAAAARRVRPNTALAYLRRVVRNEAVDLLRRRTHVELDDEAPLVAGDDGVAKLLHERATAATVEALLAESAAELDLTATRVINSFLNLAEELGSTPSSRLVAQSARVSHTTVLNVMSRLRTRLAAVDHAEKDRWSTQLP